MCRSIKTLPASASTCRARAGLAGRVALASIAVAVCADASGLAPQVEIDVARGLALTPGFIRTQVPPGAAEAAAYQGLHLAVVKGNAEQLARLMAAGADLDARDERGRTPLMVAAHLRNHAAADALIAAGADVNALDHDRYDVLTIAGVIDDVEMVRRALAAGGDPRLTTSPYDGTALIASAHLGHVEVVAALIAAGAPLDHVNNLAWTALIEAIVLGDGGARHTRIVQMLVAAGADVNLADGNGTRPLGLARGRGYEAIASILEAANARP